MGDWSSAGALEELGSVSRSRFRVVTAVDAHADDDDTWSCAVASALRHNEDKEGRVLVGPSVSFLICLATLSVASASVVVVVVVVCSKSRSRFLA